MNADKFIIRKYNILLSKSCVTYYLLCLMQFNYSFYSISCQILVVGGGTAGCSMAAKLSRKLKDSKEVIVLEPSDVS